MILFRTQLLCSISVVLILIITIIYDISIYMHLLLTLTLFTIKEFLLFSCALRWWVLNYIVYCFISVWGGSIHIDMRIWSLLLVTRLILIFLVLVISICMRIDILGIIVVTVLFWKVGIWLGYLSRFFWDWFLLHLNTIFTTTISTW